MKPFLARAAVPVAVLLVVVALLAAATDAFAGKPVKGATYNGTVKQNAISLLFKVSASGRRVTKLTLSNLPLFCQGGGAPSKISFDSARIRRGRFHTSATQTFHGSVAATAKLAGKFTANGGAKGSLNVTYPKAHSCSGSTTFTAAAAN